MKKLFFIFTMLLSTVVLMAKPVSEQQTLMFATDFFHQQGGKGDLKQIPDSTFKYLRFYQSVDNTGFVIMSADDCVLPILGYSIDSPLNLNNMGANTLHWLKQYDRQIAWHIENKTESLLWTLQKEENKKNREETAKSYNTANLMTTTWSQSPYYNNQCPYDQNAGTRTMVGCTATAMGQIMKYWKHPKRGMGSYSYVHPHYGTQSADFSDTIFDFVAMPNILTAASPSNQVDAVALLLHRCGIAVEMYYGVNASSAVTNGINEIGYRSAENAYREHFKYMHTLHTVSLEDYDDSAWVALIKNEIDHGRPVHYDSREMYTGGGHSFICSGYDNTGKLYFNWGWNGYANGYYQIGQLNPNITGSPHFNLYNKAIIGIEPDTSNASQTTITLVANILNAGTMTGSGIYTSYQDTVIVEATGNAGYLFKDWNDGVVYNPYLFIANGGNVTHTANFEKMHGDTLGYCYDENVNGMGVGSYGSRLWGIRLDSNSIAPRRMLTHVQMFIGESGEYKIHVFEGDSISTAQRIHSDTLNVPTSSVWSWINMPLSTPVAVDRTKTMWIVMETSCSGYPVTVSDYRGNPDGSWIYDHSDGWLNFKTDIGYYYTFQIRGVFTENPGPYQLTVVSDNEGMGSVTGSGVYAAGDLATITAIPNGRCQFMCWQDGNTDAMRTIEVSDNTTYTAYFSWPAGMEPTTTKRFLVYTLNHDIFVKHATGCKVTIYDEIGRLLASLPTDSDLSVFHATTGAYFVVVDGKAEKVVIP